MLFAAASSTSPARSSPTLSIFRFMHFLLLYFQLPTTGPAFSNQELVAPHYLVLHFQ